MLVVLLSSEPGETSATMDLTVTGPAGGPQRAQVPVPEASLGGEVGFMLLPLALAAPVDGRYLISVGGGGRVDRAAAGSDGLRRREPIPKRGLQLVFRTPVTFGSAIGADRRPRTASARC